MRSLLTIMTALAVIGLAFWAYGENYKTKQAQAEAAQIQRELREARARLNVLRAEWAYLNRPERLRELADLNFDRLGLLPFLPEQFGRVDLVPYPVIIPDLGPITDPVEVASSAGTSDEQIP